MKLGESGNDTALINRVSGRLKVAFWLFGFAFLVLIGRLWQLQVLQGEAHHRTALANIVDDRRLRSVRGSIFDRHGVKLATNRPAFSIYAAPSLLSPPRLREFSKLLSLSTEDIKKIKSRLQHQRGTHQLLILEDQGLDSASLIFQARSLFPDVSVRDEPWRFYPFGEGASHLLGYMNKITERELKTLEEEGYLATDTVGRYGLERQWETYLRGRHGVERFVHDVANRRVGGADDLIDAPLREEPVAGHNLILSLDFSLQRLVEEAVREQSAAAVAVVEVESGRVLALVSKPTFNSNTMTGKLSHGQLSLLMNDPRKPFIDKTLQQHYPPGSTFKFVAALSGLKKGVVDPDEKLFCGGVHEQGHRKFRCTSRHGWVNLEEAIQHSCNVYFWQIAERIGIDSMAKAATSFGFGVPSGLGLNGDVPGRVPTRAWYEQRENFKIGHTLNFAVGQGDVEVTVLQLAMAYGALANGGNLFIPQVVDRIETSLGETIAEYPPILRRKLDFSPEHFELVKNGMWRAVNMKGGTAFFRGRTKNVVMVGKTGTAQVRSRIAQPDVVDGWHPHRDHAWFAGYAPADKPEIAIAVLVEHGGSGGKIAAPVAKTIVDGYFAGSDEESDEESGVESENSEELLSL